MLLISIVAAGVTSFFHLKTLHSQYWGEESQTPQGTIWAVQTVEHNISAHAYPFTIAKLLNQNRFSEIEEYMYSSFTLTGFAVTTCNEGSSESDCINEKVVAYTKNNNWITDSNIKSHLLKSDFNLLTDSHGPGVDWKYTSPKNHTKIDLKFKPEGKIIGRIYYIRRPSPLFTTQLRNWAVNDFFISSSTDKKYYFQIALMHTFGWLLISILALYAHSALQQKNKIQVKKQALEDKNKFLTAELNRTLSANISKQKEIDSIKEKETEVIKLISNKEKENEDLKLKLKDVEEGTDLWEELVNKEDFLNKEIHTLQAKNELQRAQLVEQKSKFSDSKRYQQQLESQIKNINEHGSKRKKTLEEDCFYHFIDGLNTHCPFIVEYHGKVISEDIGQLVKQNYDISTVEATLSDVLNTFRGMSSNNTNQDIEKLKGFKKNIFHNKRKNVRIYFTGDNDLIHILSIWSADVAPHKSTDKKWSVLQSRLVK